MEATSIREVLKLWESFQMPYSSSPIYVTSYWSICSGSCTFAHCLLLLSKVTISLFLSSPDWATEEQRQGDFAAWAGAGTPGGGCWPQCNGDRGHTNLFARAAQQQNGDPSTFPSRNSWRPDQGVSKSPWDQKHLCGFCRHFFVCCIYI